MTDSKSVDWLARLDVDVTDAATMDDQELLETVESRDAIDSMFERVRMPNETELADEELAAEAELIPGYCIKAKLGSGGFGEVILATDEQLGRDVAIKRMRSDRWMLNRNADNLLDEARVIARLSHPGIVTLHDAREHAGRWHLISEYISGGTLEDVADKLDYQRIASICGEIARALAHAHSHSIVHRDLKLSNVLIDEAGHARVTDFGLAIDEEAQAMLPSHAVGTLRYMAPEQLPGGSRFIDGRTDIWSLGIILYRLLTGRFPFGNGDVSRKQLFAEIRERLPKPPSQLNPEIPQFLSDCCLKCLEKDPAKRYASAADVAEELESFDRVDVDQNSDRIGWYAVAFVGAALTLLGLAFWWPDATNNAAGSRTLIPSSAAQAASANTRISEFRLRHYRYDDDGKGDQLGILGRETDRARENDELRVEAAFETASYACLFEVSSQGQLIVHQPSLKDGQQRVESLNYPLESNYTILLSDGPGPTVFGVIAASEPIAIEKLTTDAVLSSANIDWKQQTFEGVWRYTQDHVDEGHYLQERSTLKARSPAPVAFEAMCEQVQRLLPGVSLWATGFQISNE